MRKTEQIFEEDIELEDPFVWKEAGVYQMIAKDRRAISAENGWEALMLPRRTAFTGI